MIIDSSASSRLVQGEPDADRFFRALSDTRRAKRMSAANYLEAAIVIDGTAIRSASRRFDDSVVQPASLCGASHPGTSQISPAPPTAISARQRVSGGAQFRRLFRLRPRQVEREPLLFKGDDFAHTDVAIA